MTVGIVTALANEHAAMLAMLDQPVRWSIPGRGAGLVYYLDEIAAHDGGRHVVALALADMGNNSAATRGSQLLQHFPHVEAILMVGIAGGVPNPDKASEHVRLGDVVVSDRFGVVQYDFIKKTAKINLVRSSPRPPHPRLLEAARLLEADAVAGARPWEADVQRAAHLEGATRPDMSTDVLLSSRAPFQALKHPSDRKRIEGQPRIFFGPIASANTLLKDPVTRDRLREQHGAKAVEMEGSGIADATWQAGVGYLVVRGICDYCDKNKNDDWHMYAAVVAAAYARAVLERMASDRPSKGESEMPESTPPVPNTLSNLAQSDQDFGQLATPSPLAERALLLAEATRESDPPAIVSSLATLAMEYMDLGQPTEARPLVERALAAAEKAYLSDHPDLVFLRSQLAGILHALVRQNGLDGNWEPARRLAKQSLALAERAEEPLLIAESYRLLADAALHGLDYENAKLFYEEAARRFDALDLPKAASAARLLLVPLLLQFGHVERSARHVVWLRAFLGRAEPGPEDRSDIEDVLRLADAAQENAK